MAERNRLDIVISAIDKASGTLNKIGVEIGKQKQAVQGMRTVADQHTQAGIRQSAAAAGLGVALAATGRQAAVYGQSMRDVNSIAQQGETEFHGMERAVLDIARNPKITDMPDTLARGLYDLYSSGLQGATAMDTLAIASKGAAAGQSDTATASAVLAATMNAYNRKTGPDATAIMDVLFRTVDRGVVRFEELAGSLGNVVASASTVGVGIEEVGAAIATMTKRGIQAPEAVTALNQTLMQFLSPGREFAALLEESGYQSGLQIIQARGLAGAMEWLQDATGGEADKLAQVLGEVRAVKGAMSLTGQGAQMFADDLIAMRDASGSTAAALDQQSRGPMFRWNVMMKDLRISAITFGNALLPVMGWISSAVSRAAKWFDKLPAPVKNVAAGTLVAATAGLAMAGAYNLVTGSVITMMASMTVARATQATMAADGIRMVTTLDRLRAAQTALGNAWAWMGAKGAAAWAWVRAQHALTWRQQVVASPWLQASARALGNSWTWMAARGTAAMVWMRAVWAGGLKGIWASTAAQVPRVRLMFAGLFTSMRTGAIGAWGAISKLPAIMAATGKALVAFLLSPAGIVIAALAALTYELYKLYGVYKEMRAAQKQAQASRAAAKAADAAAGVERDASGAITNIGKLKTPGRTATAYGGGGIPQGGTLQQQTAAGGVPDLNALMAAAERDAKAQVEAAGQTARAKMEMAPVTTERIVSAGAEYGMTLNLTIQANTVAEIKALAMQVIDEAFAR